MKKAIIKFVIVFFLINTLHAQINYGSYKMPFDKPASNNTFELISLSEDGSFFAI